MGVEAFVCHVPDWAETWVATSQRSTKRGIVLNMLFMVALLRCCGFGTANQCVDVSNHLIMIGPLSASQF
jgi:hypothetical protein